MVENLINNEFLLELKEFISKFSIVSKSRQGHFDCCVISTNKSIFNFELYLNSNINNRNTIFEKCHKFDALTVDLDFNNLWFIEFKSQKVWRIKYTDFEKDIILNCYQKIVDLFIILKSNYFVSKNIIFDTKLITIRIIFKFFDDTKNPIRNSNRARKIEKEINKLLISNKINLPLKIKVLTDKKFMDCEYKKLAYLEKILK